MMSVDQNETSDVSDKERKGDQPNPAKVESKRQEQSGKTFQGQGQEVRK